MPQPPTACLALADGTLFYGHGFGATGMRVAELCFNTAMTGYQEIMTDPSYAGQIVTFTFPHIGNVGVNAEDDETGDPVAEGMVVKWDPTEPSNWRATGDLVSWLERTGRVGIGGLDTRRLTRAIRQQGAPHVALAHDPDGKFDLEALVAAARGFKGLEGVDLARVSAAPKATAGTRCAGPGPKGIPVGPRAPRPRSWRSITARNATSCAASPARAAT
jgi:carbamoyl-phosphate synthase small subunit